MPTNKRHAPCHRRSIRSTARRRRPASRLPDASSVSGKVGQSSSFRNVSACHRCRLRKNRCDLGLPSCASCDKAGVNCVSYDPITKKEIPRRSVGQARALVRNLLLKPGEAMVYYLETRVEQLESLLQSHHISLSAR